MNKQFQTERAASQQKRIGTSLIAMMEDTSYQEITVSGICNASSIPRRTFYYYFNNKD